MRRRPVWSVKESIKSPQYAGSSPVLTTKYYKMVNLDKAVLVGEGEWVKDSAYRVYELDGKYYSVIVIGQMNLEIFEDSIQEIQFEDISKYIGS